MEIRLQKILAQAGYGSRRSCEEIIAANRVSINGVVARLGAKADLKRDKITVDGKEIGRSLPGKKYIALNKPRYVLSDHQENDGRRSVFDLVDFGGHCFLVGRLDYDSEGLVLMTNDGELANRLTHPRYGHEKEYRVLVARKPDAEQLATWRRGVVLDDGVKTAPAKVEIEKQYAEGVWLRIVLREGRKRQIRETGTRIGLPVRRIQRVRIGTLELGQLKPGEWRNLTNEEINSLHKSVVKPNSPRGDRQSPGSSGTLVRKKRKL
ncbi:MAG: rRNA pseudouridine synthase [Anaerolineae bacterium]|nr:rRNA pseudouridine synthase [Anaerolineae bacterium]